MRPDSVGQTEKVRDVLKEGWHFVLPLAVLVGSLLIGYTALLAAVFAIGATIAASWISSNPMSLQDCFDATVDGVRNMTVTALLLVAVGLVINVVTTTGVGNAFSLMIVEWAQGSLLITIALVALASLILGMGLPVTASYIVLATLSAPVIYDLIAQDYLLQALQSTDLSTSVRATLSLFGGDPDRAFAGGAAGVGDGFSFTGHCVSLCCCTRAKVIDQSKGPAATKAPPW